MSERIYTVAFPFCGAGFGALGFIRAATHLLETELRFRSVGGIDNDPIACREFERLTSSPALCADVSTLTPEELRAAWGDEAPDVLFGSPPCRGFSGLLGEEKSRRPEYQKMNLLVTQWLELVFATWAHAPPRLILLENVPRVQTRGRALLRKVQTLLNAHGYVCHKSTHDCGELGGLAQHRRRFLLVARLAKRVPLPLYKPIKKRVRGCGEVLAQLPVPGTEEARAAGPLHELPALSWINWVRLALIPAGGDWRDLRGVLEEGQARREVFRRHHVQAWGEASSTVGGDGSNGPRAVADPRLVLEVQPGNPRAHEAKLRVESWETAAHTVTGSTRVGSGAPSVADPRPCFRSVLGVTSWLAPSNVITGNGRPQSGTFSVADPRVDQAFDHGYGVLKWQEYYPSAYGVLSWEEAAGTVTGEASVTGVRFAIADLREVPPQPVAWVDDPRKPAFRIEPRGKARKPARVPVPIVIRAADGTWHRPLTTLELALLQGAPTTLHGEPFNLADGRHSIARSLIGNAVPVQTAQAIAEQMLLCLASNDAGAFALSSGGSVWVEPKEGSAAQ